MTSLRPLPAAPRSVPAVPFALAGLLILVGAGMTSFLFSRAGVLHTDSVVFAALVIGYLFVASAGLVVRSVTARDGRTDDSAGIRR